MDRRSFFRSAINKSSHAVGKAVVKAADASVNKQAVNWIRPPFAKNELEFLLSCTRCNDCIEACPHQVIFSLSAKTGIKAAGTPALDLLNKGCHLCEDWPCVTACTAQALTFHQASEQQPESVEDTALPDCVAENIPVNNDSVEENIILPVLAKAGIDTTRCLPYSGPECGACLDSCPIEGALILEMVKPVINTVLCNGCALCREACITEPKAITIASL